MKFIDMTGQRHGRFLVLKQGSRSGYWIAVCDCGETREVRGHHLRTGRSQSCGCLRTEMARDVLAEGMVGKTFGRLTVVSRNGTGNDGQSKWDCRCDCGKSVTVRGVHLRYGKAKSCGCLRDDTWVKALERKEVVAYGSAHSRVKRINGPARTHKCIDCDNQAVDWSYQGGDPNELTADNEWKSPYSLDQTYYVPRCRKCHNHFDKAVSA